MENNGNDLIFNISSKLKENCCSQDLFEINCKHNYPSRDVIIKLIKDLRRLLFPGYFGKETLSVFDDYSIPLLQEIREELREQIIVALRFDKCSEISEEEINAKAESTCDHFISSLPQIQKVLFTDVEAIYQGDPAAQSKAEVITSYPGTLAIFVYRLAHVLYLEKIPAIPRLMNEYAHSRTGIDIHAGAEIGSYFFIDHGTGIVIGETTVIGDHVKIYQGVTLGALSTRRGQELAGIKRHPTIGNYVTIYSGASILGGETIIGDNVVIGGNSFITKSISSDSKVSMKSSELLVKSQESSKKKIDTIIFDLDGTLLDTADDLMNSLNRVLFEYNYPQIDADRTKKCLGNGIKKFVELNVPGGTENPNYETIVDLFKKDYLNNCAVFTKPYEGIIHVLHEIKKLGLKTAIVSNKADFAVQELTKHYFDNLIDVSVGESESIPRKPNPQMIEKALKVLGSSKENAVYIGDSEVDLKTAENAKLDCISVAWGFRSMSFLKDQGAKVILSSPEDLLNILG
jgi:serine O-acetyltransferase